MTIFNSEVTVSKVNKLVFEGISGVVVEQDTEAKRAKVTPELVDLARHIRAQSRTAHGPFVQILHPEFLRSL